MERFWMFPLFRPYQSACCRSSVRSLRTQSRTSLDDWRRYEEGLHNASLQMMLWRVEQHSLQQRAADRMDKSAVGRSWRPVCTVCLAESGVFHSELHRNKQEGIRALRTSWSGVSTAVMRTSCRFTHRCESCKNTATKNNVSALFKFMLPGNRHPSFARRENWIQLVLNDWFRDGWPPSSVRSVTWWGSRVATISRWSTIFCGDNRKSWLDDRFNQSL